MKLTARAGSDRADPRLPGELEGRFLSFVNSGDRVALDQTVESVTPELRRIARYYVRREDLTEDLVQATILTSIERASSFDPTRRLVPWLTGILLNKIAAQRRESQRRLELDSEPPPEPSPLALAESKEVDRLVQEALDQLPPHYREVLDLYLRHGKRGGEIASELHRPPGTIRAQIHRGLRRLRALLPPSLALGALFTLRRSARGDSAPAHAPDATDTTGEPAAAIPTGAIALALAGVVAAFGLFFALSSDRAPGSPAVLAAEVGERAPAGLQAPDTGERLPSSVLAPTESVAVATSAGPSLELHTLDRVTGSPLSGVTVEAYADTVDGERLTWTTTSDQEGRIRLPVARDRLELLATSASSPGYAELGSRWDRSSDELTQAQALVVPLITNRPIGGTVVDENGMPVEGAAVLLNGSLLLNGRTWTNIHRETGTHTDENGRWSITDAATAPMQLRIRVVHPEFVPSIDYAKTVSPGREALWAHESRIVLRRGRELEIDVRDESGVRIPADVTLVDQHDPPRFFSHVGNTGGAPFTFTLPEVDGFLLRLSAPGHDTKIRSIRPRRSAGRRLELRMLAAETRKIAVVDETGTPIRNALVRRYGASWDSASMTDADGELSISVAPEGVLWVEVRRGGVLGSIALKADLDDGFVRVPRPRSLELTVLDAAGSTPLSDYSVELMNLDGVPLARRFIGRGEGSRLSFQSSTRALRVRVTKLGYETAVSASLHPEAEHLDVEIALRMAPALELTVLGPNEQEVDFHEIAIGTADHPVLLRNGILKTSSRHPRKIHGKSGSSVRINRPQEPFALTIISRLGFAYVRDVDLDASTTVRVRPWGCLEGHAEEGTEIALGSSAEANRPGLRIDYRRTASPDGSFHFCSVPPGPITTGASGGSGAVVHGTVLPGETIRTEL